MKEYTKEQRTWIVLSKLPPTRRVKIDTYEYESLARDILDNKVSYDLCRYKNPGVARDELVKNIELQGFL